MSKKIYHRLTEAEYFSLINHEKYPFATTFFNEELPNVGDTYIFVEANNEKVSYPLSCEVIYVGKNTSNKSYDYPKDFPEYYYFSNKSLYVMPTKFKKTTNSNNHIENVDTQSYTLVLKPNLDFDVVHLISDKTGNFLYLMEVIPKIFQDIYKIIVNSEDINRLTDEKVRNNFTKYWSEFIPDLIKNPKTYKIVVEYNKKYTQILKVTIKTESFIRKYENLDIDEYMWDD